MNNSLLSSRLYDNKDFYKAFKKDLLSARNSVLIESPFITTKRMNDLLLIICKLHKRGVKLVVNARCPDEHGYEYAAQAVNAVATLQDIGIKVLYTGKHHRKLAIIDNEILWEGSLNILSQNNSCEIMRRTESKLLSKQMLHFIGVDKFL